MTDLFSSCGVEFEATVSSKRLRLKPAPSAHILTPSTTYAKVHAKFKSATARSQSDIYSSEATAGTTTTATATTTTTAGAGVGVGIHSKNKNSDGSELQLLEAGPVVSVQHIGAELLLKITLHLYYSYTAAISAAGWASFLQVSY